MKLIKDKKYVITSFATNLADELGDYKIKFPQEVLYDGNFFLVKDKDGLSRWSEDRFNYVMPTKIPLTIQFIPRTRKGVKYFQIKITKQGKVFNHQYNSKQGAKKSFESLVNDIKNDNFIVK